MPAFIEGELAFQWVKELGGWGVVVWIVRWMMLRSDARITALIEAIKEQAVIAGRRHDELRAEIREALKVCADARKAG